MQLVVCQSNQFVKHQVVRNTVFNSDIILQFKCKYLLYYYHHIKNVRFSPILLISNFGIFIMVLSINYDNLTFIFVMQL